MNNFEFLKSVDKNLYEIISDAEKLYRDEYFEQCIGQTRRFGENVCKNVLGSARTSEKTFDDMLATLKDKSKEEVEKEFIDDLYFLKREGNASVHAGSVKKDGIVALECLQRAFEVALNYAVYNCNAKNKSKLLKLRYDTEMLVTGKKFKKSLAEKYEEEKANQPHKVSSTKNKNKKSVKQSYKMNSKKSSKDSKISFFKIFLTITAFISAVLFLTILLLALA